MTTQQEIRIIEALNAKLGANIQMIWIKSIEVLEQDYKITLRDGQTFKLEREEK